VSIATTFAPELASAVATKSRHLFVERMSLGVRIIALLTLPFSFLTLVAARPIIGALLQHGNFSADAALNTARALMGFSLGLVGFSVFLFTLRGFYAHEDTRTPFVLNLIENGLNIVLAVVFVRHFGVLGLGLAFAIAYLLGAVLALVVLEMKVREFEAKAMIRSLLPMLLAAVVSAQIAWFVGRTIGATAGIGAFARSVATYAVGIGAYLGLLVVLKVPETRQLVQRLRRAS
jgi:putative peptidoglycan lipid II flippase